MSETIITKELITWEPLPVDFELPDDPVDDLKHLILVEVLGEPFYVTNLLISSAIIASNFGICACVGGQTIVKAPDWMYVPFTKPVVHEESRKSYTPHLDADVPSVVMEFLSDSDNGEYDVEFGGKWWFYEKIVEVPCYVIFAPSSGRLEVYRLRSRRYTPQIPNNNGRYWIPGVNLFLGVWYGTKRHRMGYWLRWWDEEGNMLLLSLEKIALEQQKAADAKQKAADAKQEAADAKQEAADAKEENDRLKARLRELGIDPDAVS
ncbi:MAG: hypothetical protein F6K35_49485 [Okeania sp. SIO2H7]|nr:hypothetical protein [Okeania sp. SIO2H7]